jgi:hypothetical protein
MSAFLCWHDVALASAYSQLAVRRNRQFRFGPGHHHGICLRLGRSSGWRVWREGPRAQGQNPLLACFWLAAVCGSPGTSNRLEIATFFPLATI